MIKSSALALVSIFCLSLAAAEYTGTVERFKTGQLGFENQGRVVDIQRVGLRVSAMVFDEKNNLVSNGDILAAQDTSLWEAALAVSEADLKQAVIDLKEKQSDYERCKQLRSKNALSQKDMDAAEKERDMAVVTQRRAEASLRTAKYNLDACFLRAPFDGEIESQLASEGTWVDQGVPIVTLTVFSVMRVIVDVPEDLSRKLSLTNKIRIISPLDGEPLQPAWLDDSMSESKKLNLVVMNRKTPVYPLTEDEKKLPVVNNVSFVINKFGEDITKTVWIPENSISQDEKGSFVWIAKNQNLNSKTNSIDRQFTAEKLYLKSLDKFKNLGINTFRCVENPGDLKLFDVIIVNAHKDLQDGSKVVYQPCRWLLRPGDQIKVVIE